MVRSQHGYIRFEVSVGNSECEQKCDDCGVGHMPQDTLDSKNSLLPRNFPSQDSPKQMVALDTQRRNIVAVEISPRGSPMDASLLGVYTFSIVEKSRYSLSDIRPRWSAILSHVLYSSTVMRT